MELGNVNIIIIKLRMVKLHGVVGFVCKKEEEEEGYVDGQAQDLCCPWRVGCYC